MKFLYSLTGSNVPVIKEFDAYSNMKVKEGDLVFVDIARKVTADDREKLIGVSAETHSGEEDVLNERSNKNRLRVDITSGGVYSIRPMYVTATKDGTKYCFYCSKENVDYNVEGFKLVLVEKGEGSKNTDSIGDVRIVGSGGEEDDNIFMQISEGGTPCKGDVYAMYPGVGTICYYDPNNGSYSMTNRLGVELKTVNADLVKEQVEVKFINTIFKD